MTNQKCAQVISQIVLYFVFCQLLSVTPRNKQHNFHNIQLEWIITCMSKFRQGLDSWLCFLT